MDRREIWIFAALGLLAGCSGGPPPSYKSWVTPRDDDPVPGTRYFGYCRAADLAEKMPETLATKVSYSPDKRRDFLASMNPALAELTRAQRAPNSDFGVAAAAGGKVAPHHFGWVLIGRALAFKVEDAIEGEHYARAIEYAIQANQLGFDLSAVDGLHASLGFAIAAESRRALAKGLDSFTIRQLGTVASRFDRLLQTKPALNRTLEGEERRLLAELQLVQDAFVRHRVASLAETWNVPPRYLAPLNKLAKADDNSKVAFFEGLSRELRDRVGHWQQLANLPTRLRDPKQGRIQARKAKDDAPWAAIAALVASGGEVIISQNDEILARTRLLISQAKLLALAKQRRKLPSDLGSFGEAGVDPYTGRLMAYRADGSEFRVYSAGPNGIDDGGQTDESGTFPDVTL